MSALGFVPVSAPELAAWARQGVLPGPRRGYAVTSGLRRAFEPDDDAEAENLALLIASVAGLISTGRRLVVVVAVEPDRSSVDDDFGEVSFQQLSWDAAQSIFADESDFAELAAAIPAAAGKSLAAAWNDPIVFALVENADLLWYGPGEWEQLARS